MATASPSSTPSDGQPASQRAHWLRRQHTTPHLPGGPCTPGAQPKTLSLFQRYMRDEITLTEAIELTRQQNAAKRGRARRAKGPHNAQ